MSASAGTNPGLSREEIRQVAEKLIAEDSLDWQIVDIRLLDDSDENQELGIANQWVVHLRLFEEPYAPIACLWSFDRFSGALVDKSS